MAIFYDFSSAQCLEAKKLMFRAHKDVEELMDDYHSDDNHQASIKTHCLCDLPELPDPITPEDSVIFLASTSEMKSRKPYIKKRNFSLHIQDQGYGPNALLTFRKMDSELPSNNVYTNDDHSRAGILGRIVAGTWNKILEGIFFLCIHTCM
jgi:hypothetical protein